MINKILELIMKDENIDETFRKGVKNGINKGTNGKANKTT